MKVKISFADLIIIINPLVCENRIFVMVGNLPKFILQFYFETLKKDKELWDTWKNQVNQTFLSELRSFEICM